MPRRNRRSGRRRTPDTTLLVRELTPEEAARQLVVAGRCSPMVLEDRRGFLTPKEAV